MTSHDNLKTTSHDNLKTLSLFSGISGLSIGQPVMYCEIDKRATDVLKARMKDGSLPKVPIHTDVTTLLSIPTGVDLLEAGFPCQDISCAGVQRGFHGKKSILFYHVARLVETSRPPLVFFGKRGLHQTYAICVETSVDHHVFFGVRLQMGSGWCLPCRWSSPSSPVVLFM